jgi:hypothetical protein
MHIKYFYEAEWLCCTCCLNKTKCNCTCYFNRHGPSYLTESFLLANVIILILILGWHLFTNLATWGLSTGRSSPDPTRKMWLLSCMAGLAPLGGAATFPRRRTAANAAAATRLTAASPLQAYL